MKCNQAQTVLEKKTLFEEPFRDGKLVYMKKISEEGGLSSPNIVVYFVEKEKKKQVAYSCFNIEGFRCIISGMGIDDESFKRKGIGSKMLSMIEEECQKCGAKRTEVPTASDEGRKLLKHNNYKEFDGPFFKGFFKEISSEKNTFQKKTF